MRATPQQQSMTKLHHIIVVVVVVVVLHLKEPIYPCSYNGEIFMNMDTRVELWLAHLPSYSVLGDPCRVV